MQSNARVLVADDDPDLLRCMAQALRALGAQVVLACDGAELLSRLADEGPFTVIVTDICMPWMSGLQAMHAVRYAGVNTPIVVITALKDARYSQDVRALGRRAQLLRKPFELDQLEAAIDAVTSNPERASHDAA